MRDERGYTFIELIVASAIVIALGAALLGLLHDGLAATPALEEMTDLHQRARVSIDRLDAEIRAAAAGSPSGPLSQSFAAIEPRAPTDAAGTASSSRLTVRYVPHGGAHSRLVQPLAPSAPIAFVDTAAGCPVGTTACGFNAATTALISDTAGSADLVSVDAIGPGALTISDVIASRAAYPAGSEVVEARQVSFIFDPAARQLRRLEGGGSFVLVDNVTAVNFEYFAGDMTLLPPAVFQDGPFVGAGSIVFDVDLLRVRTVRATLRLDTGVDRLRGTDPRFFARPGTATGPRVIPDAVARLDVTLRNGS
jgi:hypothetical protein